MLLWAENERMNGDAMLYDAIGPSVACKPFISFTRRVE